MYVVGWNKEQCDTLKIELLEEHIKYNLNAFHQNTHAGLVMLGVFDTHEQASTFCDKLREIRAKD